MTKVFVGISGGVDSAVSAALLKESGHDVTGVFIKIWRPEFIECTWKEDRVDAMRVCVARGIPFREIDLSNEYQKGVVATMIEQYSKGITPNPDVLCNEKIKFGSFASWAFENGADLIATGHYAQKETRGEEASLLRGADPSKDQSYFLHRIGGEELNRTLFPIGGMHKSEVRTLARKFNLPNADRPDSQGLCFVGDISLDEFLARYIALAEGDVVDLRGNRIGSHKGAALYTIGQRHGFTAPSAVPLYVSDIDVEKNVVTVSESAFSASSSGVRIEEAHWISGAPAYPYRALAQARYREKPFSVTLENEHSVTFDEPHVVSPGQSIVFYDGDRCLGGGVISS